MAHAAHDPHTATVIAGVPSIHKGVFHRIRFMAHDPACLVELPDGRAVLILRDVELARAKSEARADEVYAYQDFTPDGGLSADREVAAAQSLAECLRRHQIKTAYVDRALPLLFADELQHHDVRVVCDRTLSARRRRSKDAAEVDAMRRGQRVTEDAIRMACELIADATADDSGVLRDPTDAAQPLTSERVKSAITVFLAERGFVNEACIVAGGAQGADCITVGPGRCAPESRSSSMCFRSTRRQATTAIAPASSCTDNPLTMCAGCTRSSSRRNGPLSKRFARGPAQTPCTRRR